jgi:hypothetical protein
VCRHPHPRDPRRYGYHRIDPPYRLWIWQDDLAEAREALMLRDP